MKKLIFLIIAFASFIYIHAQNKVNQPFRLDLASGLVFPVGETYLDQRILFSLEPKYNISDRSSLGLRMELAPSINFAGTTNPIIVSNILSFLLTGDYFFDFRESQPFVGAGAGIFDQHLSNGGYPEIKTKEQVIGIMTRAGVEIKRFRIAIEFNTAFKEEKNNINYISIKVGAFLFGKRVN
jgi:hypothetical protein